MINQDKAEAEKENKQLMGVPLCIRKYVKIDPLSAKCELCLSMNEPDHSIRPENNAHELPQPSLEFPDKSLAARWG